MMGRITCGALILFVLGLGVAAHASAQLSDSLSIHGFGGWAYGRTDNENVYLMGYKDGNYSHLDFSLNLSISLHDDLRLYVQPGWDERQGGNEVNIDYAFAEWFWADALSFRIGKVKAPFMIYSEVYSVGTIRPFFSLPPGIYRDAATESYKGVGITGFLDLGDWEIQYDLYGGKLERLPVTEIDIEQLRPLKSYPQISDTIGTRVMIRPPIEGLSIGISSYSGENEIEQNGEIVDDHFLSGRYIFWGLSMEYLAERYEVRTEYLTELKVDNFFDSFHTAYCEMAYSPVEKWQLAVRGEFVETDVSESALQAKAPDTLYEHMDVTLGLNYWISQNFVIKLAYHYVIGNHFAYPEEAQTYAEHFATDDFTEATNLMILGTQFSF